MKAFFVFTFSVVLFLGKNAFIDRNVAVICIFFALYISHIFMVTHKAHDYEAMGHIEEPFIFMKDVIAYTVDP